MVTRVLAAVVVGVVCLSTPCLALDMAQQALAGLKGVYVLVEKLGADVERQGLSRDQIRQDVEQRLRKAGIEVLTATESLERPGKTYLYVHVNTFYDKEFCKDFHAFAIRLTLREWVTLARGRQAGAGIWERGGVGMVHTQSLAAEIREGIGYEVDNFISDYLAANPKR